MASELNEISTRPWGERSAFRRRHDDEPWTKLHYDAFCFWDRWVVGLESREAYLLKSEYTCVVFKIHKAFRLLRVSCSAYASSAKIEIDGLAGEEKKFDEEQTVNANFKWIREMLTKCDQSAEAQLRRLDDAHSTTLEYYAKDRAAAETLVDAYLTTGSCDGDLVPASKEDQERDDVANQVLLHVGFRRFHALVHDDVARLIALDETFARHYEYWERPPQELIELVLRAKDTVDDTQVPNEEKTRRLYVIFTLCNIHERKRRSSLHCKAHKLRKAHIRRRK
mmetsp:Transcript_33832/g.108147  ORF Transcript_33832/g.108147 Transcript_33832/m.108147 type:complete len:281 (+) Transcript_33832:41-883(+)